MNPMLPAELFCGEATSLFSLELTGEVTRMSPLVIVCITGALTPHSHRAHAKALSESSFNIVASSLAM